VDDVLLTPTRRISRRHWLASLPALGGLLLTGCSRETFMPPVIRGGLIGAADVLTMSSSRLLLSGQQLAREYARAEIADPFPTWNQTNPKNAEYQRHAAEGFKNWRLPITGLVARPVELSLDQIRSLPARTQITAHVCEQGWSAIGEWTGAPLELVLDAAGGVTPQARYVVIDTYDRWYEAYDLFEVQHPQTILAYGLNGRDLPRGNGEPVRLRVERQCGYKNLKFVKSIQVVDTVTGFGKGTGGINSDVGFHWYAGV
jgi:DMSO/TMAO reductase YedYZ molybdopterin-dependent catalytic subunit